MADWVLCHGRWVIGSGGITFTDYPFFPATVFLAATIAWEQIDGIHQRALHPTVRVGAELLMVPARHKAELKEHAERRRIPIATWHNRVWDDILEPFLDTWFDEEHQQRTMSRLQSAGIGPQQVIELRARFGPAMRMHNLAIPRCERVHLGLFDLLAATHPDCTYPDNDWTRKCRASFSFPPGPFCDAEHYSALYWQAMRIALASSRGDPQHWASEQHRTALRRDDRSEGCRTWQRPPGTERGNLRRLDLAARQRSWRKESIWYRDGTLWSYLP